MKKAIFMRLALIAATLLMSVSVFAQKLTVTGKITDATGQPVIGAAVFEKGTSNGAATDVDGSYTISVNPGATLVYSCIGYAETTRTATGNGAINVTLAEDTTILDETVVVGYGTQKKVNLTGAVDVVTSEVLDNRPVSNLTQGL